MTALEFRSQARRRARAEFWRRGQQALYLLDAGQLEWRRRFWLQSGHWVWKISRQRGKTYGALVLASELCAQQAGTIIRYAAKTADSAEGFIVPNMKQILEDCPPELRPDDDYLWSNGSLIAWAGTDAKRFDLLRGPRSHFQLYDESGFYPDLPRTEAALLPQLQTTTNEFTFYDWKDGVIDGEITETRIKTGGKALYLCSPPESPSHPFNERFTAMGGVHPEVKPTLKPTSRVVGNTVWATIEDNPRLGPEGVKRVLREEAELRGMTPEEFRESTYCRREYFAEDVAEESRAACPAWTDEVALECTREWTRPEHFHAYTGHDWGGQTGDPHAALFGYVDHKASKLIIEREHEKRGIDTKQLAAEWKALEVECWGERAWDGTLWGAGYFEEHSKCLPDYLKPAIIQRGPSQPFLRVCDHDEQLQKDMLVQHGYALMPTEKHKKHLMVDEVNVLIRERRIIIHPRCRRLLEQLRTALWDEKRRQWVRTERDHADLIDCLVYIVRNIAWNYDPAPPPPPDYWGQTPKTGLEDLAAAMSGRRRR